MSEDTFTRVGDYQVLGVLGAGGMGKVYKVRNVITDRVEAMKVLLPDLAGRRELADRFLREIKILAGLSHPNIASLHTALTWDNQLVMIMEYVEGVTLAARLKREALSPAEAIDYICQVLSALSYAHGLHIIHRDIKPANMMLTPAGVVKLMDFGIARSQSDPVLTASGSTLGSVQYMSPEQVRGEHADLRSDLYSVGISLYEMVTRQRPFQADSEFAVMAAHLQKTPTPPNLLREDLPPGLNEIILMAMEKDPAQRFQSADAFRNALQSLHVNAAERAASVRGPAPKRDEESTGTVDTPLTDVIRAVIRGSSEEHALPRPATDPPDAQAAARTIGAPAQVASAPQAPSSSGALAQAAAVQTPAVAAQPQRTQAPQAPSPLAVPPPVATVPRPPTTDGVQRGLYIALGSLIVLIVLVAAGIYIPRTRKTHASTDSAGVARPVSPPAAAMPVNNSPVNNSAPASSSTSSESSSQPVVPSAANVDKNRTLERGSAAAGNTVAGTSNFSGKAKAAAKGPSKQEPPEQRAAMNVPNAPLPAPSAPSAEKLQELEHEADLLASRAEAVDVSLDGLRQNQAAQGVGLRGDIAASQQRMRVYMTKAQSALKNRDADGAKKYLDLAETEVARLEKFVGR